MTGAVSEPAESDAPELSPEPEQPAIPKIKIAADRHPITRLLKCLIILPPSSKIFLTECVKYSMLPSKIQPPPVIIIFSIFMFWKQNQTIFLFWNY